MSWSRDQCQLLIDEYQKHPCLYAVKNPLYKNRHARTAALETIQKSLSSIRPGVTSNDIKAKLNGLRTTFLNEHKKVQTQQKSGSGRDSSYQPTIWYYERMFFILEHVTVRPSLDSLNESMEESSVSAVQMLSNEDIDVFEGTLEDDSLTQNSGTSVVEMFVVEPDGTLKRDEDLPSRTSSRCSTYKDKGPRQQKRESTDTTSLISSATTVLDQIATQMHGGKPSDNGAFAAYVAAKMGQIPDDDIRLDVEEQVASILFEGIKKARLRREKKE